MAIYSTWGRILSDRNIFCTLRGGRKTVGSNAPEAFLVGFTFFRTVAKVEISSSHGGHGGDSYRHRRFSSNTQLLTAAEY